MFAVFVIFKRQQGGKGGQQGSGQEKREFLVAGWERGETHLHQFGLAELPFAPFAPFAEFGVVPFDAAAGGASLAAGPPSGLAAVAALAESMAALAFVCSSVCGGWPSAQSVSRVRRPHSPTLRFVRLLVGKEQERVCSRVSSSVRPSRKNKSKGVSLLFSLSLSLSLDSHLSRQRAAGDSLSLPAEPRRPSRGKGRVQPHPVDLPLSTPNHCPKKKVSLPNNQHTARGSSRAQKKKARARWREGCAAASRSSRSSPSLSLSSSRR